MAAVAGSIDKAPLRFNGKIIANARGDTSSLIWPIVQHYIRQGIKEAYKVVGSVEFLGNPVGLVNNIGDGMIDFFYEPAQGLLSSPEDFAKGLGKGTSSLLTKGVGGALGAASKVVGSVSKGFAVLSMDDDFISQRGKVSKAKPKHAGQGLLEGGKSLGTGVVKGLTGLVTDPLKGAQQNGIGGFATGLAKGLVGVVAKPVSGLLDATSATLQGIGNTTAFLLEDNDAFVENTRVRPQRFIDPATRAICIYDRGVAQSSEDARARRAQSLKLFATKG